MKGYYEAREKGNTGIGGKGNERTRRERRQVSAGIRGTGAREKIMFVNVGRKENCQEMYEEGFRSTGKEDHERYGGGK